MFLAKAYLCLAYYCRYQQFSSEFISAALLSDPLQQPTLRKSSSAIDWNGAVIATRKNSKTLKREEDHQHLGSHGVFGGMFHRGFFSKPVVRSEEENYRYLMALDR
uniref:Secreted protein n=1 Tax=Heterorhabditis bacteriophora TaxID=37862 RepID=A0A1I7WZY0_HETBA